MELEQEESSPNDDFARKELKEPELELLGVEVERCQRTLKGTDGEYKKKLLVLFCSVFCESGSILKKWEIIKETENGAYNCIITESYRITEKTKRHTSTL